MSMFTIVMSLPIISKALRRSIPALYEKTQAPESGVQALCHQLVVSEQQILRDSIKSWSPAVYMSIACVPSNHAWSPSLSYVSNAAPATLFQGWQSDSNIRYVIRFFFRGGGAAPTYVIDSMVNENIYI